jgi:uncharacterized protein (TIGR02996 family)
MDDTAFLQAMIEAQGDDHARLRHADWLQTNGQVEQAELLRLHHRLLATCCEHQRHPERAGWQARLVGLLAQGVRPCVPQRTVAVGGDVDMTFAWVSPGRFLMGSRQGEEEEFGRDPDGLWHHCIQLSPTCHGDETRHQVTLTKGFWLGVHEITQAQWQAVMGCNPSKFEGEYLPVERVSWDDCQEFCERLSQWVGMQFRLPTEAEWEYACRAGTTTPFFFGLWCTMQQANFAGGVLGPVRTLFIAKTTAVGKFPPNAWGLFDMHGNVDEWCQDWYGPYPSADVADPKGPEMGRARVRRGGNCRDLDTHCRSANRQSNEPALRGYLFGCRVCLCLE